MEIFFRIGNYNNTKYYMTYHKIILYSISYIGFFTTHNSKIIALICSLATFYALPSLDNLIALLRTSTKGSHKKLWRTQHARVTVAALSMLILKCLRILNRFLSAPNACSITTLPEFTDILNFFYVIEPRVRDTNLKKI